MRILLIAGVALVAVLLEARPVQAYEDPRCAMMSMGNGGIYEDCHYASFEACCPNVLGRRAERKAARAIPAPGPQQLT
ncbi:MAG: DUF3551 domain-containing protein, partial [Pseudolabrys sp.]